VGQHITKIVNELMEFPLNDPCISKWKKERIRKDQIRLRKNYQEFLTKSREVVHEYLKKKPSSRIRSTSVASGVVYFVSQLLGYSFAQYDICKCLGKPFYYDRTIRKAYNDIKDIMT